MIIVVLIGFHCMLFPNTLIYPYSLLRYFNLNIILPKWFVVILYLLNLYSWLIFYSTAVSTGTLVIDFIFSNIIRCHFLSKHFHMDNWGKNNYTVDELILNYRRFELVVKLFLKYFSANLISVHFTLVPGVHCATYILIRNFTSLDPMVKFVFLRYVILVLTLMFVMLTISGAMHKNFKSNTQSWLRNIHLKRKERTLLNIFRKSCRPMFIGNNMVKVGTNSAGKFITVVSRDTFRTVITFRVV